MKNILTLFLLTICRLCSGQNLLLNPDFELYSNCPTALGQIDSANSWLSVVQSSDYYNCGLSTNPYQSNSIAYSGTGFVGFASYGNSNGSSEAIGQNLFQPFVPGQSYTLSFAAKKPLYGMYANNCGGVALYGYKSGMPLDTINVHLSQFSNSLLLGISSTVQDTAWQLFSLNFIPTDTINSLALTVQHSPNCRECVFIDYINLHSLGTGIVDFRSNSTINIFPNPFSNQLTFSLADNKKKTISLYDFLGKIVLEQTFTNTTTINTEQLTDGIYFYVLHNDIVTIQNGKVIKK